jgi:hypothetical protein
MVNNGNNSEECCEKEEKKDFKSLEEALLLATLFYWISSIFQACIDKVNSVPSSFHAGRISVAPISSASTESINSDRLLVQDERKEERATKGLEKEQIVISETCVKRLLTIAALPQRFELKRGHHTHSTTKCPQSTLSAQHLTVFTPLDQTSPASLSPETCSPRVWDCDLDCGSSPTLRSPRVTKPQKPTFSDTVDIVETVRGRLQQRHKNLIGRKVRDIFNI